MRTFLNKDLNNTTQRILSTIYFYSLSIKLVLKTFLRNSPESFDLHFTKLLTSFLNINESNKYMENITRSYPI